MGTRMTIRDVAVRAGVSVGTVSRVINHKPVSARSRTLVSAAMQEMGYTPNAVAQSMRTRNTRAVGLVVNDISNPLFSSIAKAAEEVLREKNYWLLISNTDNDPVRERIIIESLVQRHVDGLMIAVSDETDVQTNGLLQRVEFPVVLLDRELRHKADAVCDDHAAGMRKAVRYLFDLGHREIALISGGANVRPGRERVEAFRKVFAERGLSANERWIRQARFDALYGYQEAHDLLSAHPRPTALIAGGNQIFTGALRAIRQLELAIPADLSVVSCDDIDLTVLLDPAITVIARNMERIGQVAAELLLRRISGKSDGERCRHIVATELIVRDSCAQIG